MPASRNRVRVGVWTSPPNVSGRPKPTSSISTMRTFGAPGLSRSGSFRHFIVDSCNVGPATLADGVGGNGKTEPSASAGGELC